MRVVYQKSELRTIMRIMYRIKQIILLSGDLLSFFVAFFLSVTLRQWHLPSIEKIEMQLPLMMIMFFLWIGVNYMSGLYDLIHLNRDKKLFRRVLEASGVALIVGFLFFYILPTKDVQPKTILALTTFFGYGLGALLRFFSQRLIGAKQLQTRLLLVGYSPQIQDLVNVIKAQEKKGYTVAAIIDPQKILKKEENPDLDIYTTLQSIRPLITNKKINLVVVSPELRANEEAMRELYELLFWPVSIIDLFSFYETITGRIHPATFSEGWFLENLKADKHLVYTRMRITFDYTVGVLLGLAFLVLFPFIYIAIKINSRGPVLLKQERVGLYGTKFTLYKFRSMYALSPDGSAEVDGYEFAKKDDKRITLVGKILRKTRLDELPQAWNLLRGDLAFIGPRPERPEIVKELTAQMSYYPLRHVVKPGLTGWAVIHQNYTDTIELSLQKLQYDLYYIKNRSFLLDVSIVLRTLNMLVRFMGQ